MVHSARVESQVTSGGRGVSLRTKSRNRNVLFSALTVIAAVMGIAADFVLGFVTPGSLGRFSIVQTGWAEISLWRPGVSMLLAAIAFPIYLFGIHVVAERIAPSLPKVSKVFWVLSIQTLHTRCSSHCSES